MKKHMVLALSLMAASTAAVAQTSFYATADYTAYDLEVSGGGSASFGALGVAGGVKLNEFLAAEVRLATGANDEDLGNGVSFGLESYIGAQLVGSLPLDKNFSLYGTLGYGEAEVQASQGNVRITDSDTGLSYGAGVQYDMGNLGLRVGYESIYDSNGIEVDGFKLTGIYRF